MPEVAATVIGGVAVGEVVDLFSGPRGWDGGLRLLGIEGVVGIEWDDAACATANAAGFLTIRADVAAYPTEPFVGKCVGLIGSPPCTMFSNAGSKAGHEAIDVFAAAMTDLMSGRDTRTRARHDAYVLILPSVRAEEVASERKRRARGLRPRSKVELRAAACEKARERAFAACLVVEPARWAHDLRPRWIALEQVPSVLPLWEHLAGLLRAAAYSVWTGTLNAADFGVPQTRTRAILVASLDRAALPPEPTHSETPGATLFGELLPWVSMAEALGWVGRVGFPRLDDLGTSSDGYRERDFREVDEPAMTITEKARSMIVDARGDRESEFSRSRTFDAETRPARTVTHDARDWTVRTGQQTMKHDRDPANAVPYERSVLEPSPTLAPGARSGWVVRTGRGWVGPDGDVDQERSCDEPSPTLTGARSAFLLERRNDQSKSGEVDPEWPLHRPATTIATRDLVPDPGANANRHNGAEKSRNDGYRITEDEAAVLQSFPADYPWQGSRTKKFQQIGNAVPPLLAAHVLAALLGLDPPKVGL